MKAWHLVIGAAGALLGWIALSSRQRTPMATSTSTTLARVAALPYPTAIGERTLRELQTLLPHVADAAGRVILAAHARGYLFGAFEGYRSRADQRDAVARGVSKTLLGWHQTGRAVDLVGVVGGRWNWDQVSTEAWTAMGEIAEHEGFRWGGRWTSFRDMPHIEWRGDGAVLEEAVAAYETAHPERVA